MPVLNALRLESLKRYRDIAALLVKYGRADIVAEAGLDEELDDVAPIDRSAKGSAKPQDLVRDIELMGPTFIKLAQLISTRSNLLPVPYIKALVRLQDHVEPFPFDEVVEIISSELGVRISKAFQEIDPVPIGSASLGQVHRAVLRNGREVAIKVQRPGVRKQILDDFVALNQAAEFFDNHTKVGKRYRFQEILEEFRKTLMRELDYRQEAQNLHELRNNLKNFDKIIIPEPIDDYCSSHVLTMDHIRGRKVTELSPFIRMELSGAELADQLFHAYLQQILVHNFFHADPHAGNVLITDDGRVGLIDLGMVGRNTPEMQEQLLKLLLCITEGRSEDAAAIVVAISVDNSVDQNDFDESRFRRQIADLVGSSQGNQGRGMQQIDIGQLILELSQAAGENGMRVPPELTMLGKTLLNLHEVVTTLDSGYDPAAAVKKYATEMMQKRVTKSTSIGNIYRTVLETKEFVEKLPGRVNKILDGVANNQIKFKMEIGDEELIAGAQKIANRITMGLILAALILAGSNIMLIPSEAHIFGYPALAMLFFTGSAIGGVMLIAEITRDKKPRAK